MKYIPHIVGALLGLFFIMSAVVVLAGLGPKELPPMPEEALKFNQALMPTGYMHLVKVCELMGGILVAIPKTRNFGLLLLGPIIVNIAAFHIFLAKDAFQGGTLVTLLIMGAMSLYLLWVARAKFAALKN